MKCSSSERLLYSIGEIEDSFLVEAETADNANIKIPKRKSIVKYGMASIVLYVGIVVAFRILRPGQTYDIISEIK